MADDIKSLADKYRNLGSAPAEETSSDVPALADKFRSLPDQTVAASASTSPAMSTIQSFNQFNKAAGETIRDSSIQGVNDVINTVGQGIGAVDRTVNRLFKSEEGQKRSDAFNERVAKENTDYDTKYGDSTVASVGRMAGQTAATLPLVPGRIMQGISMASRALPSVLKTGETVAAPIINRLGAAAGQGAIGGGIFGAATSASNDKGVIQNTAENMIAGALVAPMFVGAHKLGQVVGNTWQNIVKNYGITKVANDSGISPTVAQNIIKRLDEAGLTPADAARELTKMGPKATLADLDPLLEAEAGSLASRGGRTTSLLKNTYNQRASEANDDAVHIFESKFGPKPDVIVERGKVRGAEADKIQQEAEALTGADYKKAHASAQKLDASGVVQHIDDLLQTAVGRKASALKEVKGYLYNEDGSLKTGTKALHEARKGIDDLINTKGDSLPPGAASAVENIRAILDTVVKKNPLMVAADAKYAEKMDIKEGLVIGYEAISKGIRKQEFAKIFDNASPEVQETIKKGMHAAVRDKLEAHTQGELSGTERLFGKKDVNRSNFKHAFGQNAEQVLDDIAKATAFKSTERAITQNSKTAERLAIQDRYGSDGKGSGNFIKDATAAAALDLSLGAAPIATGLNVVRSVGSGAKNKLNIMHSENLAEGSADLLSRQGAMRDSAMSILERVHKIESKYGNKPYRELRLPTTLPAAVGQDQRSRLEKGG